MVDVLYGELLEGRNGNLRIWKHPEPNGQYVLAADTASGVRGGDYSAAEVLDAFSCEQVAEWHGHYDPTRWGFACARLGYYYNSCYLAFETHPSPHGLTAFDAAVRYGYPKMWVQRRRELLEGGRWVTRKGWQRSQGTTAGMFDRARTALAEGCVIHSERLLDEMSRFRLLDGKFKSPDNDDCLIAYCIALMVRDDAWSKGEIQTPKAPIRDMADFFWQRRAEEGNGVVEPVLQEPWNGI